MRKIGKPRVWLVGGDGLGWALDAERRLTRQALDDVTFGNIITCDVIHSVYWPRLLEIPREFLIGKRVISHLPHDPGVAIRLPGFEVAARLVGLWIVRSARAREQMAAWGLKTEIVPYELEGAVFHSLPKGDPCVRAMADAWGIPAGFYVIGSFQRDTEGGDLRSPKLVKGPDVFAEIVAGVHRLHRNVLVVLAGPRRHWLRGRLGELGVPFTFIGEAVRGDDLGINTLPRAEVNVLYNVIDLYVVSSRAEGGPQAVIEAAGARCKILSSDVGIAAETLHEACIYGTPAEAVSKMSEDVAGGFLDHTVEYNFRSSRNVLTPAIRHYWKNVYAGIEGLTPVQREDLREMPGSVRMCADRARAWLERHGVGWSRAGRSGC